MLFDYQELLRPREAAALLCISTNTLINYDKAGILTCYRTLGNHRRYLRKDIEKLLTRRTSDNLQ